MRIALLTPYYAPGYRGGGPIRTAVAMVAEHGADHEFLVLTGDTDWGETAPLPVPTGRWIDVGNAKVWYARAASPRALLTGLGQVRRAHPDVLYLNSVLHPSFSILPLALAGLGYFGRARVLLAPRGELGTGALGLKASKKRVFLTTARALGLHRSVTWHASSGREAAEITAVFPGARVVIRENEVLLPPQSLPPTTPPTDRLDEPDPALRIVFLSRLAPKKGLHLLLTALARVTAPVTLRIVGDGDPAYRADCLALAALLPPNVRVSFVGPVPPERVPSVFASADLFAFPTAHENFGHVVAEALATSCPVLLADVTPWTPVLRDGGGALVGSLEPADWAAAIDGWAAADPAQRLARRQGAGRAYDDWQSRRVRTSVFDLAFG